MTNITSNRRGTRQKPGERGALAHIGMSLLVLLAVFVALISALPVILLYFVTSVPVAIAALLTALDIGIIVALFRLERTPVVLVGALAGWIAVAALAVVLSQSYANTPLITDENGVPVPGSIASLEQIELGGSQQWVTIRGQRADLPVLLFLAGGPGGSELAMTRRYLGALEEHFIIVNWDQPGTGKSYNAVDFAALTPERYTADGLELANHLRAHFGQEKIYLFGESWGSILGVWMVQQQPELFHALITTGQMVDVVENDVEMYDFALEQLAAQGRADRVAALEQNGPPPYAAAEVIGKFNAMNGVVNSYMHAHARGEGTGHNLLFDSLGAPEYGLLDKVRWVLGLANTFTTVYPQIYDVDLRAQAPRLEVPVTIIKGRWDINASNALTEEYFALLEAPHKELIWFENSAHTPMWDEPAHFTDVLVNTVLAQATPAD